MKQLVLAALVLGTSTAHAQVLESSDGHFVIQRSIELAAEPAAAWEHFLSVGDWWHPDHTYAGDAEKLYLDPVPGGCFCEALPGDGFVEHMAVVYADEGVLLRMTGGLGPLQEHAVAGAMTWTFGASETGTRLELTYRVSGVVPGGLAGWAGPVDGVLATQLSRLQDLIASSQEAP